jgi:hypothetical protein
MGNYVYYAVPFIGKIKSGQTADEVSRQLTALINEQAAKGWEFYQLGEVRIQIAPGCLAALFGARNSYVSYNQVVFRREA